MFHLEIKGKISMLLQLFFQFTEYMNTHSDASWSFKEKQW